MNPIIQLHTKVAVLKTLMSRAEALSSSGVEWVHEEKEITGTLKKNGYPSSFVYKYTPAAIYITWQCCDAMYKTHKFTILLLPPPIPPSSFSLFSYS